MLKKNLSKSALVVALLTTTVIWRGTTAYAEDPNQAFTLDPMIVTAQRTETRDLDTPATTNIITEQNIRASSRINKHRLRRCRSRFWFQFGPYRYSRLRPWYPGYGRRYPHEPEKL